MLFEKKSFELALAMTCKMLYDNYKKYYENQMALMLYDSQVNYSLYKDDIEAWQKLISQTGWARGKFISVLDFQNGDRFSEKFSYLKLLGLNHISFSNAIVSILPKLPSLNLMYLCYCNVTEDHLSKIFKKCIKLEELHLMKCKCPSVMLLKPPRQLKVLQIKESDLSIELDLSLCTKFEFL